MIGTSAIRRDGVCAIALACLLALAGAGCSTTRVVSRVAENPLTSVAEKAKSDYSVTWVDENTLELSKPCVWHSILTLGYTARHADLHYTDKRLEGAYYVRMNNPLTLFLPVCVDTSDSAGSWLLRIFFLPPAMEKRMHEVLDWAGAAPDDRTETYAAP